MTSATNREAVFWQEAFSDGLDYAAMMSDRYGLQATSVQLTHGRGKTRFAAFSLPRQGLELAWSRILEAQFMEFRVPAGHSLVSFSLNGRAFTCNGVHVDGAALSIYPGGAAYAGSYPDDWASFDILIDEDFGRSLVGGQNPKIRGVPDNAPLVVPDCGDLGRAFLARLQALFARAEESNDPNAHYLLALEAVGLLSGGLATVIGEEFERHVTSTYRQSRRPDLLDAARALLEENPGEEYSAEDIARELGVSYRTLHYAFDDAIQMSPYQFFLLKRLHELRETLKTTDLSVKDACYAHGFHTLSRFRRQYQRLFGELPSETRAAARRTLRKAS